VLRGLISTRPSSPRNRANNPPTPRAPALRAVLQVSTLANGPSPLFICARAGCRDEACRCMSVFIVSHLYIVLIPFSVSKPTHDPPHSSLRALTSSELSSESSSSEYAPFASLVQPQCSGKCDVTWFWATSSPNPAKPFVDIGQLYSW
jgi:hypothetical protein